MKFISQPDVLTIGAGIAGLATARELSKYQKEVTVVEKEPDVGWGSTKANLGIVCQGADSLTFRPGMLKAEMTVKSIPLMEGYCKELDVPFKRIGALGLIKNEMHKRTFEKMKRRVYRARIDAEEFYLEKDKVGEPQILDKDTVIEMEPNINKEDLLGAFYEPDIAVTSPYGLAVALAENAKKNGVELMLETEVLGIDKENGGFIAHTNQGDIKAGFVVNAAGLYADKIASMVRAKDFVYFPLRGQNVVLDKKVGDLVKHMVFLLPPTRELTLNMLNVMTPTVYGNTLLGIQLELGVKKGNFSTTSGGIKKIISNARKIVPSISEDHVINSFTGFMAFKHPDTGWHEFTIGTTKRVPRFVNVNLGYPGVSACPQVAKRIVEILANEGLELVEKPDFNPRREGIPDFSELSDDERKKLIDKDPRYGRVVCRCEHVTEGEIIEAIERGATTVDGVKFRTRAGMGRCQAGFCGTIVPLILARELNLPVEQVTKKGGKSRHVLFKSKELIGKERGKIAG